MPDWENLTLPALDPARPGDGSLWPARWPAAALGLRRAEVGEHDWQSLYQQHPVAQRGRVYASFARTSGHVLPHAEIARQFYQDGRWLFRRLLGAIDWGFTDPGCVLVLGQTATRAIYVLHEEYRPQVLVDERGWLGVFRDVAREYRLERYVADPSEPGYITAARRFLGGAPVVENAHNDILEGIRRVQVALQPRPEGGFGMYVSDRCVNLIDEAEQYAFKVVGGALSELPHDRKNHALDCWRYGTFALTRFD